MIKHHALSKKLTTLLTISLMIGLFGCSMNNKREQYFEAASSHHYRFQQIQATKTHPPEYEICGDKQNPCLRYTSLNKNYYNNINIGDKHHVR